MAAPERDASPVSVDPLSPPTPPSTLRLSPPPPRLESARLILRRWTPADLPAFEAICRDPTVMQHYPCLLTAQDSHALAGRIRQHFDQHGFGRWAVELKRGPAFIGFLGLTRVDFNVPFAPAVELSWRLDHHHWGQGYASEAATLALTHAFDELGLKEVVSFTVPRDARSRRLMARLGMQREQRDDFEHPRLPHGHPLRPHVLYRLTEARWRTAPPSVETPVRRSA